MVAIEKTLSNKIANAGIVCAILVVMIHLGGSERCPQVRFLNALFANGICTIAVPMFFAISGFLLSGEYVQTLRKRARTLLVPYLFWGLVTVAYLSVLAILANLAAGREAMQGVHLADMSCLMSSLGVSLSSFASEPSHGPLWYIRALMVFMIVSPAIRWLVLRLRWRFVAALWFVAVAFAAEWFLPGESWLRGFFTRTFPLPGICYFAAGMLLRRWPVNRKFGIRISLLVLPIGLAALAFAIWMKCHCGSQLLVFRTIFIACTIGAAWYAIPDVRWPATWTSLSFPLYIVHYFFSCVYWWYLPKFVACSALWWCVKLIVALAGSVVIVKFMKRVMPRFSAVVFGGRA